MRAPSDKFDVRAKLAIVACLSTTAVFIQHLYVLLCLLAVSVVLSAIFYSEVGTTLSKTKRLWYVFGAIIVLQSIFTRSGVVLFGFGNLAIITSGGLVKGLEFFLRISIIIFSATIIASSKSREVVQGLVQLKIPYEIAFMVSVGIRFLPLLKNEISDSLTAIQLRGVDLKKIAFKKRVMLYSYIFTPVLAGALNKAHRLSVAMEARAFRAYGTRSSYRVLKLEKKDYAVIISSFLVTSAIFISYYVFDFPKGLI